jgi:hypothetical protein
MAKYRGYASHRHGYKANTSNDMTYLPPTMPLASRRLSALHSAELREERNGRPIAIPEFYSTEFDYWHTLHHALTDPYEDTEAKRKWEAENKDQFTNITNFPPWLFAYLDKAVELLGEIPGWVPNVMVLRWKQDRNPFLTPRMQGKKFNRKTP